MVVCRWGLVGCLVVACCFRRGRVWVRRVGRRLSATWNVGSRVLVPDLRNPLPNATYTVDGWFHYTTDGWARTVRLEVDRLDKVGEAFRSRCGYIQSRVNKYGSELAADIDQRYEGGHIVGDQFGGPPEEINTVAMLEEVNQTSVGKESNSYLLLERKFAAKPENYNNLVLEFEYPEPADPTKLTNTERFPKKFEVKWMTAAGEADSKPFENLPPQKRVGVN